MSLAPLADLEAPAGGSKSRSARGFARVLIVSPHFPPINAPDHHRARTALPHLAEHGWTAEILAVRTEDVEGIADPDLAKALPQNLVVHRVSALPARWTRRFGWGSLALRAYRNLRIRGDTLLATGEFDLVLFSTTQFGVLPLGPYWKQRHGVPYVLDFQDEWISAYYADHPKIDPPGGRIKFRVNQWMARRQEPEVIRQTAQIISVSSRYNDHLRARYPEVPPARFHALPFGGAQSDFEALERNGVTQDFFDPADGRQHWVYAGRGGADMEFAAGAFLAAVRRGLDAGILKADALRIHFLGTSYAPVNRVKPSLMPLARAHGLEKIASEHPGRLPYFTALRCLREARAVLIFGSDDSAYTASKIHPAILARRPLLALFHAGSGAVEILRATRAGTVITFQAGESGEEMAESIFREWIVPRAFDCLLKMDDEAVVAFSAATMTRRLCQIFEAARIGTAARR